MKSAFEHISNHLRPKIKSKVSRYYPNLHFSFFRKNKTGEQVSTYFRQFEAEQQNRKFDFFRKFLSPEKYPKGGNLHFSFFAKILRKSTFQESEISYSGIGISFFCKTHLAWNRLIPKIRIVDSQLTNIFGRKHLHLWIFHRTLLINFMSSQYSTFLHFTVSHHFSYSWAKSKLLARKFCKIHSTFRT